MYRIIGADGREYGPISADILRQWIAEGRAIASTRVLAEGSTEWKLLGALPEFSILFASAAQLITPAVLPSDPFPQQKSTAFAVTGLVLGIVSLSFGLCCCYGLPFNITGLVFSILALGQIRSNPDRYEGKGMAIAGVILCALSLLWVVLLVLLIGVSASFDQMTHPHGYRL